MQAPGRKQGVGEGKGWEKMGERRVSLVLGARWIEV